MTRSTPAFSSWGRPALLLLSIVAGCGDLSATDTTLARSAIFAGTPVAAGEWESVVALQWCSGVLVTERVVVYAAHCGTHASEIVLGNDTAASKRRVPIAACRAHPDAALGNGRDVAFCALAEPITDLPPLRPLDDAQQELVRVGTPVTQVGYGLDTNEGRFGVKRRTVGAVQSLGDDLVIVGTTGGTCEGDSGGPAAVRLDDLDPSLPPEWRLLGVLSAGTSFDCEISTDHYSNIRGLRTWIASESASVLEPASAGCRIAGPQDDERLPVVVGLIVALSRARRRRGS